ncbi:MAG: SCO family protein [bacterium]|jgi:hypothetical protein|nr:hypothetical protein [Rhodocyclaceae bacterium]MCA4904956.1 hypothetical protein [Rhodocyclaceae bacterium]MCE2981098.1 hypothetical protein [Betaproteobacteria bacterium]
MKLPPGFRRKLPLIVLVLVCATPAFGPYLLWFFWKPGEYSNYGELVQPVVLPEIALEPMFPVVPPAAAAAAGVPATPGPGVPAAPAGAPLPGTSQVPQAAPTLRGKWFLVMADGAECDARCERKIWQLRQLRTMQGKEMERVERVWLVDDRSEPAARLHEPYAGTWVVRRPPQALLDALPVQPGSTLRDHLWLVDPLGNLMMRYPPDADATRIRKDMTRLLKYSRIG